jgi:arginase
MALSALRTRVDSVYLHLDLDVLDPTDGVASGWAAPGGPPLADLETAIRLVGERFAIPGAGLTAYDPEADTDGRAARAGLSLLGAIARAAHPK